MNVQGALIDETQLVGFEPPKANSSNQLSAETIALVAEKIKNAKRPVILAGQGIRISGGITALNGLLSLCDIPVVTTFNGIDLLTEDHKNYVGRFGTLGNRAGNFCVQNADVLITIGTRNNIRQVSYNWEFFAREAYKIVVDIDPAELEKPTVIPDMGICADAKLFLEALTTKLGKNINGQHSSWLEWCIVRKAKYPTVLPQYADAQHGVHPYHFMDVLGRVMPDDFVCVTADGTACVGPFQAMPVKNNFRIFWNSGCASMGYELPAAVGACVARGFKDVVCLAGDGSIQLNIQELQTVIHHQMPIKIFYLNNNGYISIKQTQDGYFGGHRVGCDPNSGVSFPDIQKLGAAYGLKTCKIDSHADMQQQIEAVLQEKQPIICEVMLVEDYKFTPRVSSKKLDDGRMVSAPLEDLAPFLDREEFRTNLFIKEFV
jgi:acetolactate synthase-1/2/3 large subunit